MHGWLKNHMNPPILIFFTVSTGAFLIYHVPRFYELIHFFMCVSSLNVTLTSFPERNGRKWKTFQQETERGRERERERERCNEGDVLFFSNHRNVAEFWFDIPTHEVSRVRIRASFESRSWRRVTQASNTRTKAQPNVNGVVGTFAVAFRV